MIYKELRKQRGETIKQTAAAIGISASHLGRIESHKRTLTDDIEDRLKKHFNIDFRKCDKLVLVDKSKLDEKDNEIKVTHEPVVEIQNQVTQQLEQVEETHTQRCTRYRKPIPKDWDYIDVYRVCELFNVDDSSGATQQAMKKLIAAGTRGYKDKLQDYKEAQFAIDEKIKLLEGAKDA